VVRWCRFSGQEISSAWPEEWTALKAMGKRYSADFMTKIAVEAIRGDLTLAELAAGCGA